LTLFFEAEQEENMSLTSKELHKQHISPFALGDMVNKFFYEN